MNKYKVEFEENTHYVVDVLAKNEEEAKDKACTKFDELEEGGMLHYHETRGRQVQVGTVYDVTDTDDPFDE